MNCRTMTQSAYHLSSRWYKICSGPFHVRLVAQELPLRKFFSLDIRFTLSVAPHSCSTPIHSCYRRRHLTVANDSVDNNEIQQLAYLYCTWFEQYNSLSSYVTESAVSLYYINKARNDLLITLLFVSLASAVKGWSLTAVWDCSTF